MSDKREQVLADQAEADRRHQTLQAANKHGTLGGTGLRYRCHNCGAIYRAVGSRPSLAPCPNCGQVQEPGPQ